MQIANELKKKKQPKTNQQTNKKNPTSPQKFELNLTTFHFVATEKCTYSPLNFSPTVLLAN